MAKLAARAPCGRCNSASVFRTTARGAKRATPTRTYIAPVGSGQHVSEPLRFRRGSHDETFERELRVGLRTADTNKGGIDGVRLTPAFAPNLTALPTCRSWLSGALHCATLSQTATASGRRPCGVSPVLSNAALADGQRSYRHSASMNARRWAIRVAG